MILAVTKEKYGGPQVSRQNFLSHGKTFFLTAKLSFSRQNFLSHGKTLFLTAKLSFSRQNFLSQGHTCLHRMTLPKQDINSFITQEGMQQYLPVLGRFWKLLVYLPRSHCRLQDLSLKVVRRNNREEGPSRKYKRFKGRWVGTVKSLHTRTGWVNW